MVLKTGVFCGNIHFDVLRNQNSSFGNEACLLSVQCSTFQMSIPILINFGVFICVWDFFHFSITQNFGAPNSVPENRIQQFWSNLLKCSLKVLKPNVLIAIPQKIINKNETKSTMVQFINTVQLLKLEIFDHFVIYKNVRVAYIYENYIWSTNLVDEWFIYDWLWVFLT